MPPMRPVDVAERREAPPDTREPVFEIQGLTARYGTNVAIKNVNLEIYRNLITAVIGPSGCGKSTFIRCLNRMNDDVPSFDARRPDPLPRDRPLRRRRRAGRGAPPDRDGLPEAEPVPEDDLRQRRLGAARARAEEGPRRAGRAGAARAPRSGTRSRTASRRARSRSRAASSSGSASRARSRSSRRSCCSTSRPRRSTRSRRQKIEELMHDLKEDYTLVIVTHNMQQAARVADRTAFFSLEVDERRPLRRPGRVRRDDEDLHGAIRQAHRGLRDGSFWLEAKT